MKVKLIIESSGIISHNNNKTPESPVLLLSNFLLTVNLRENIDWSSLESE